MYKVKSLMLSLGTAAVTSAWWGFAFYGAPIEGLVGDFPHLFALALVATIVVYAIPVEYIHKKWDSNSNGVDEIRCLSFSVFSSVYTSSWWACGRWGHEGLDPLWIIPALMTLALLLWVIEGILSGSLDIS